MSQHNTNNYAVIVDYLRTPFAKAAIYGTGKAPGRLADINPVDLQVPLINAMLERTGIDPNHVKKVLTGCVHQEGPQGLDIARHNVLHEESLLPHSVGGTTLDRFCASSMEALSFADGLVGRNPDAVYICTGVQSMSQVPIGGHNPDLNDKVHAGNAPAFMDMASTAENLAVLYGITREEQDAYSLRSHQLHAKAADEGRFKDEILPLKQLAQDDGVRRDTTMAALAKLPTTAKAKEKGGTITPGSSSQVTDGASAAIVTSEAYARANNLPVLGRIIAVGESGCAPEIMGIGPVEASKEAFRKSGLKMSDMGVVELNEAFAAQALAVEREWAKQGMAVERDRLNVNGGAIAMGHPFGATGIRLVGTLCLELKKRNERYGLATLCIGGGQGMAVIVENPDYQP